ncbi:hypothetical protein SAMD00019534_068720 [Acytostelium subglobosum LB1]|uniref:hypothetical protein n=1 Tax=Acytostelium subglobosum LB1 TaxID=1410327 RepID=UPI0006450DE6|nr:hypothetical protein SAMD00019534_068720 [Acytostelium subglobosum LB1]GAM23697.1 hypothetical protein SAMD00019534_068720 [Acytostelium subglobosum LB1]|eukprot:XP_012753438.1 hypothetical protein SAMD00019534_068720 [Acytostelium subglobosum LB1]
MTTRPFQQNNNLLNINNGRQSVIGTAPIKPIGIIGTLTTPMQTPRNNPSAPKISLAPIPMGPLTSSINNGSVYANNNVLPMPISTPANPNYNHNNNVGNTVNRTSTAAPTTTTSTTNRYSAAAQPQQQQQSIVNINTNKMSLGATMPNKKSMPSQSIRPSTIRSESRPINDKAFQSQCITRLLSFLLKNNYPNQIARKALTAPSVKDFYSICEFLFHQIDDTFKFSAQKPEDDLAAFFKSMRYPIAIAKRNLASVGNPVTWPPMLAALTWLVEVIEYDTEYSHAEEQEIGDDVVFNRAFNQEVLKSYQDFLKGADNELTVDNFLEQHHSSRDAQLQLEISQMQAIQEAERQEIDMLNSKPNNIGELSQSRKFVMEDIAKFVNIVADHHKYKADAEAIIKQHQAELARLEEELRDVEQRKHSLDSIVSEQQKSSVDAKLINQRRVQLQDEISKAGTEKKRLLRSKAEKLAEIEKLVSSIRNLIMGYNDHLNSIGLLNTSSSSSSMSSSTQSEDVNMDSSTAGKHSSSSYNIQFTTNGEGDVTITDLKKIRKLLKTYIEEQYEKTNAKEEEITNKRNEIKQLDDNIADSQMLKKRSEQKLSSLESACKSEKEKLDKELEHLMKRVEVRQQDNKQLKDNLKMDLEHKSRQLDESQAHYEHQKQLMDKSLLELKDQLVKFMDHAAAHQQAISQTSTALVSSMNKSYEQHK